MARFDTDLGGAAVKAGASALALVADGMGGEADGGAASATAVDTFVKVLTVSPVACSLLCAEFGCKALILLQIAGTPPFFSPHGE